MPDSPETPPARAVIPGSDEFRALLAACIERVGIDGLGAEEEILAAHPAHASLLRQRLDKLRRAGLLGPEQEEAPRIPERLGEFRLLRRIGAGGMGVVYVAEQESLGREVALKLVRPEQLFFPGARERFRREVDAIARLNDPGIVPIHTVGEEGGIPYFAMEYVVGASLAEVIGGLQGRAPGSLDGRDVAAIVADRAGVPVPEPLPALFDGSWVRTCGRIVLRMALAVQHAHERGVLHRDLKPSNAMVTPNGRVLILDFGLAAAEGTSKLTKSGAELGTLHYMAPEQLRGEPVDARTDVYALGVTLFELLALHAPYHSESAETLRTQIKTGLAPALAKFNPAVPRDLETICRAAFDLDPAQRYPHAQAFARDLEAFLDHRPIAARRSSPWVRFRRAAERHPAASTAIALSFLGTIASAWTFSSLTERTAQQLTEVRQGARTNFDQALAAIDRMFAQVHSPEYVNAPGLDAARAAQLDDAVRLLDNLRVADDDVQAAEVRFARARGLAQAAEIRLSLGQRESVRNDLAMAEAELVALASDTAAVRGWRGVVASLLGSERKDGGALAEAAAAWEAAIGLLEPVVAEDASDLHFSTALAGSCANLAIVREVDGRIDEAEALFRRAIALSPPALRDGVVRVELLLEVATSRSNLGTLLARQGRTAESIAQFEALLVELDAQAHRSVRVRREAARARMGLAKALEATGDTARATGLMETAIGEFAAVAAAHPERVRYQWDVGMAELQHAMRDEALGDAAGAEAWYRKAIEHHTALAARDGALGDAAGELGIMWDRLGFLLGRSERVEETTTAFAQAVANLERAVVAAGDRDYWTRALLSGRMHFAVHLLNTDQPHLARAQLQAIVDAASPNDASPPVRPEIAAMLPGTLRLLVCAAVDDHDLPAAWPVLERYAAVAELGADALRAFGQEIGIADAPEFAALVAKRGGR